MTLQNYLGANPQLCIYKHICESDPTKTKKLLNIFVQKKDFKMHKMFQKCPFYKGFRGRIVKEKGYKIN